MFVESLLQAWVPLHPENLQDSKMAGWRDREDSNLRQALVEQTVGKVLPDVGVVVAIVEVRKIIRAPIFPHEGFVRINCEFIALVFQPVIGAIMEGSVLSSNPSGIVISVGFFSDIKIPKVNVRMGSKWNAETRQWIWMFDEDTPALPYTHGAPIRFRVLECIYSKNEDTTVPMIIKGDLNGDAGLGMTSWWE